MSKQFRVIADFIDKESGEEIKAGSVFEAIDEEHEARLRAAGVIGKEAPAEDNKDSDKTEYPKHVGGGTFELSNGEKVKGKEEATAKQAELDAAGTSDADNDR